MNLGQLPTAAAASEKAVARQQRRHHSGSTKGAVLRVSLVMLVLAFATWLVLPRWYVALIGTSTQGTVIALQACGEAESNLAKATIRFRDHAGVSQVASTPWCASYVSGETLSLRYLPADPRTIVTDPELGNLVAMTGWTGCFDAVFLAVVVQFVWHRFSMRKNGAGTSSAI
jgi:hypothetical protein